MVQPSAPLPGRAGADAGRFGPAAPALFRSAALAAWLALVSRLVASSLPGSRSGIDVWIERSLTVASILSQLTVLLGSAALVLLVVATLADSTLSALYRSLIVPAAAGVLMLVMLAATMGLEPVASLAIGSAALILVVGGATVALGKPVTRGPGLVLGAAGLGAAARLACRAIESAGTAYDAAPRIVAGLGTAGYVFDTLALALALARFSAELGRTARVVLPLLLVLSLAVAWGGIRGGLDGATYAEVLASRALAELAELAGSSGPVGGRAPGTRFALDAIGLALAGALVLHPRALSVGAIAAALVLVGRHGLDVPACALAAALAGLAAPLSTPPRYEKHEMGSLAVDGPPATLPPVGVDR